jgi:DNA processing protein
MDKRAYWIALSKVEGIGPIRFQKLVDYFGTPETAFKSSSYEASKVTGKSLKLPTGKDAENLLEESKRYLEKIDELNIRLLCNTDEDYPGLLNESKGSPPLLYVLGELIADDRQAVAIVGTRSPTAYGESITSEFSMDFAYSKFTVVSGIAKGIDAVAHKAALKAGGRTIAVLGTDIFSIYPRENKELREEIIQSGAVISEFPPGTGALSRNFPIRNRTISGLSLGTVVTEAPARSGALITANYAAEQQRSCFAVPGPVSEKSEGCHHLIREGATLVTSAGQVIQDLIPQMTPEMRQRIKPGPDMSAKSDVLQARTQKEAGKIEKVEVTREEAEILEFLNEPEPVHVDILLQKAGLSPGELSGLLLSLELKGCIAKLAGGNYSRNSTEVQLL